MHISTSVRNVQHPNAYQNIQQTVHKLRYTKRGGRRKLLHYKLLKSLCKEVFLVMLRDGGGGLNLGLNCII